MDSYQDNTAFDWIRDGRETSLGRANPDWKGNFVSNLIPKGFDDYVKILHTIEASYKLIDDPHPLTEGEIAILNIPSCTSLKLFVENLRRGGLESRIRWATLARLLDVPFDPEICLKWFRATLEAPECWPRFLHGPGEGALGDQELHELVSLLRAFTPDQDCFFRFAEVPFVGTDKPILFRGMLHELSAFLANGTYQFTPEYWWPSDHSWCVCTDFDLDFTFVGGSRDLISAVMKSGTLETLAVTAHTRIDDYAPMPR